jgi:hypothetical protein
MPSILRAFLFLFSIFGLPAASEIRAEPESTGKGAAPAVTRGPYIMSGTPSAMSIRWRTDLETDSVVRYGMLSDSHDQLAVDSELTTEHEVTLANLNPAAKYYYSVGTTSGPLEGGTEDYFFVTSPQVGVQTPIRVWAMGDFGNGSAGQRAVRDRYYDFAGSTHTDVTLHLGDNAYSSGTDLEYQTKNFDVYREFYRHAAIWPAFGNHDGGSADSDTQSGVYYDIFTLPANGEAGGVASGTEAYYSFDYGNAHFICLNSHDVDRSPGGAMLSWLENDLAATTQTWIVAYWHHPPYTKGSHDSDTENQLVEMREFVLPVLENYSTDLILGGHSHVYERSYLIAGHYGESHTWDDALHAVDIRDGRVDGDGAYIKEVQRTPQDGTVYVVAGSGGQLGAGFGLNHPAHFYSSVTRGSLVLDIRGNTLDARFLTDSGTIDDHFTIKKRKTAADVDVSGDVGAADVQIVINAALGFETGYITDIDLDAHTGAVDVQTVINASIGKSFP